MFPANFFGELDFTVLDTLEQFTAVIERDFEAKAPTGTDILHRVESGAYPSRFELLRDLGQNLFWVNRYSMTMFDKRPMRWRDVPRHRDDVFLPVLTPWEDRDRKVAAVERAYHELPRAGPPTPRIGSSPCCSTCSGTSCTTPPSSRRSSRPSPSSSRSPTP